MKFRFYITDLHEGLVFGSDSEEEAKQFSLSEDYFVVDSQEGKWLTSYGKSIDVKESNNIRK